MARRSRSRGSDRGPKLQPAQVAAARVEELLDQLEDATARMDAAASGALIAQLERHAQPAADALEARLIADRVGTPELAFELLERFSGDRFERRLRRIAERRAAPGLARLRARWLLDWPGDAPPEARRAFLDTFDDRDGALVSAAARSAVSGGVGLGMNEELYRHLQALPPAERVAAIQRLARDADPPPILLLNALLHDREPDLQRAALEALLPLASPLSAGALERLALTTPDGMTRQLAANNAARIRGQGISSGWTQMLPLRQAYISNIFGEGTQSVHVIRELSPRRVEMLNVVIDWTVGITEVIGMDQAPVEMIDEVLALLGGGAGFAVAVDLAVVRGVLAEALDANMRAGRALPPEYELWEPLLHDAWPAMEDEPVVVPALDSRLYASRTDLVADSGRLHEHDYFWTWSFDPDATWATAAQIASRDVADWTDEHYQQFTARIVAADLLRQLRWRLERQAWLLDYTGQIEMRNLALAVAASFDGMDPAHTAGHPFLLRMAFFSVETAYVDPSTRINLGTFTSIYADSDRWAASANE